MKTKLESFVEEFASRISPDGAAAIKSELATLNLIADAAESYTNGDSSPSIHRLRMASAVSRLQMLRREN